MLFVLNENPIVWAMALSKVEFVEGRYVKVGDKFDDAYDLLHEIVRSGHRIALSNELWVTTRVGGRVCSPTASRRPLTR